MSSLRLLVLPLLALSLAGAGCRRAAPKDVEGFPAVAFEPMSEDDVSRFAAALPALVEFLRDRGPQDAGLKLTDAAATVFGHGIEWVGKTPGIDSVLAANNMDWPFLRAMLWRLSVCALAVGMDDAKEEGRQLMHGARRGVAHDMRVRIRQMSRAVSRVPKENVEIFQRHYRDVHDFFLIVER